MLGQHEVPIIQELSPNEIILSCAYCSGSGSHGTPACPVCHGAGEIGIVGEALSPLTRCRRCNGYGSIGTPVCGYCSGAGCVPGAGKGELVSAADLRLAFRRRATAAAAAVAVPQAVPTPNTPPLFSALSSDPEMQQLLNNRWIECVGCIEHDLSLAATVMMGGLLEGLFLARIDGLPDKERVFKANAAPRDKVTGQTLNLKDWTLSNYIDVAHELTWISETHRDVAEVLRDYRNYIHPLKEHRHKKKLSPGDCKMLWEITKHMARELVK